MWSRIPIFWWPSVWPSLWLAWVVTATACRLQTTLAPHGPLRLRTPLLTLHVSTLRLRPHAGQQRHSGLLRPTLHLVKPDSEDS